MRARRGFTLIEVVMVVLTIALLGAVALPKWAGAAQRYRVDLAAKRVAADLQAARSRAAFGSATVTIAFNPTAGSYQIAGMPDPDHAATNPNYTVTLTASPYNVRITSFTLTNTGGTANQISFDGYGTPSTGATLVVTAGSTSRTVTLDGTAGTVTVQ